ncbi:MAG: hypothetical protein B6I17_03855 [Tenericutes bacterium 4572_104]|nr:MAG: hypothetical protein B6I17_03855 [Tenericutes bacterium 4572_104]
MKVVNETKKIVKKENLPQILERIFAVCKEDPNFYLKERIEETDNIINKLNIRIEKFDNLLKEAQSIKLNLKKRIENLDQKNEETKENILEELGSEI